MLKFTQSFEDYDIIQRLKDINAILRVSESSVIERYAGISELALFRDVRKVGVLSVGLFDANPAVRALAADVLGADYNFAETANAVVQLLKNDCELLDAERSGQEHKQINQLLDKCIALLRETGQTQKAANEFVDYKRRYVFRVLSGLGRQVRELQKRVEGLAPNPLKQILEEEGNRKILALIRDALEKSEDIFCRRDAILVIGELGIDFSFEKRTFDIIVEAMDNPMNRNDYLVTWDGIRALTSFVQQNPAWRPRLITLLCEFFQTRSYQVEDLELYDAHIYHTCQHCIEALGEVDAFETLEQLLQIGAKNKYFDMMRVDRSRRNSSGAKQTVIQVFQQFYRQDSSNGEDELSERQQKILTHISAWVDSQANEVRLAALNFFAQLPNISQALTYLLQRATATDSQITNLLSTLVQDAPNKKEVAAKIKELLGDRLQLVRVIRTIVTKLLQQDTIAADLWMTVMQLFKGWAVQVVEVTSGQPIENARKTRLEALWALYDLGIHAEINDEGQTAFTLSNAEIQELATQDNEPTWRTILELFRARNAGIDHLQVLAQIANGEDAKLVRACAAIELMIQSKGHVASWPILTRFLAEQMRRNGQIHESLLTRFLPVLAKMQGSWATELLEQLLLDKDVEMALLLQLRSYLSNEQCFHLRNVLHQLLHHNLVQRRRRSLPRLRLDYLNLFQAGLYAVTAASDATLPVIDQALSEFDRTLLAKLNDIRTQFKESELPILFDPQSHQPVVALSGLSTETYTSILFAVKPTLGEANLVRTYLRTQRFTDTWVFLHRCLTDAEIAHEILRTSNRGHSNTADSSFRLEQFEKRIAARVVAVEPGGAWVDVGLLRVRPFVSKTKMLPSSVDTVDQWAKEAAGMIGTVLPFDIESITFAKQDNQTEISAMALIRGDFVYSPPETSPGAVVEAQIIRIHEDIDKLGITCHSNGKDFHVPLQELSWRTTPEWSSTGWRTTFSQQVGHIVKLKQIDHQRWSLRAKDPDLSIFTKLLYEKGAAEFSLIYVESTKIGHVFEVAPGENCYIPADRLIRKRSNSDQLEFLLPMNRLDKGDVLTVQFARRTVDDQTEVLLNILTLQKNPLLERWLAPGARVVGKISNLDTTMATAEVVAEDGRLHLYTIIIRDLPVRDPSAKIANDAQVSGHIATVDPYRRRITLDYAAVSPDKLRKGESYPCKVMEAPASYHYRLQLSYVNVIGYVEEKEITYRHTPILQHYRKGNRVDARLKELHWESVDYTAIATQPAQVLAALGLTEQEATKGNVISFQQGTVRAAREDGSPFVFKLQDFEFKGQEPRIYAGNRITFIRQEAGRVKLKVESPRAVFSLLPDLIVSKDDNTDPKDDSEALKPDQPLECVYVKWGRSCYLFEAEPGVVFSVRTALFSRRPSSATSTTHQLRLTEKNTILRSRLGQKDEEISIYTGDIFKLLSQDVNGRIEIVVLDFQPGPLHQVALSWRAYGANPNDKPLMLVGNIIPSKIENGKLVALSHILTNDNQRINLRNGIVGLYRYDKMSKHDQDRMDRGWLYANEEVTVTIRKEGPMLVDGRLRLPLLEGYSLHSDDEGEEADDANNQHTEKPDLKTKLLELDAQLAAQPVEGFSGKIGNFDQRRGVYSVTLDILAEYDDYNCWLPADKVSYNLVSDVRSTRIFDSALDRAFTILAIDPQEATLTLSLVDNPRWGIDQVDWAVGQTFSYTAFVGYEKTPAAALIADEDAPKPTTADNNKTEIERQAIIIEISPGQIVWTPVERFFIDGLPYHSQAKNVGLFLGDQMTLQVVKSDETLCLDVVAIQHSKIKHLANARRIFYGKLGQAGATLIPLEIEGYNYRDCYLAPEFTDKIGKLSEHDLFRFTHQQERYLYFRPVYINELKEGDSLSVTFHEIVGERRDLMRVKFGKGHAGTIVKSDYSYQADLNWLEAGLEPGDEFEAVVMRDITDPGFIRLSRKLLPVRSFSQLLESRLVDKLKKRTFTVVLVRSFPTQIDVEIEPGFILRVPLGKITIERTLQMQHDALQEALLPGDLLQVKLRYTSPSAAQLVLVGLIKSLAHYLQPDMLVQARFRNANQTGSWIFELPEYGDRIGRLDVNDRSNSPWFQGLFSKDMRLVTDRIPDDPSRAIVLRQRRPTDAQLVVRVEEMAADRIQVQCEDGGVDMLLSRDATYRVTGRSSYLRQTLTPGKVIIAARIERDNGTYLSLTANPPQQITALQKDLGATVELIYARSLGDEHICEVAPGELITIPAASLYYNDFPMSDLGRFLPGDIFEATIEATPGTTTELRVKVLRIELSPFHTLQPNQFLKANVLEVSTKPAGLVIQAGDLEYFIAERFLASGHSINTYPKDQSLWLRLDWIDRAKLLLGLQESQPPSPIHLANNLDRNGRSRPLVLDCPIVRREPNFIEIAALEQTLRIWKEHLVWSSTEEHQFAVSDILSVSESTITVEIYVRDRGELRANPQIIYTRGVAPKLTEYVGLIVQACVLQVNLDSRSHVKHVLLSVDGIRTLVDQSELICGIPNDRIGLVPGTWLAVTLKELDQTHKRLVVSGRLANRTMEEMPTNKMFDAIVRYTLPHGLVFSVHGILGYVPNEELAWDRTLNAQSLFEPGDPITLFKVTALDERYPFRLKRRFQVDDLKIGEAVNAVVFRKIQEGYCVKIGELLAFVPNSYIAPEEQEGWQAGKPVVLLLDAVNMEQQTIRLRVSQPDSMLHTQAAMSVEALRAAHDTHFIVAIEEFKSSLSRANLDQRLSETVNSGASMGVEAGPLAAVAVVADTPAQLFVRLVNQAQIPCSYRNIRLLLSWLWGEVTYRSLWRHLAYYEWQNDDSDLVYLLCQFARQTENVKEMSNRDSLRAMSCYVIGIAALLVEPPPTINPTYALEYLLLAYAHDKALDIQVALLLIYDKLGAFEQRDTLIEKVVNKITENLPWLLKLPKLLPIDERSYGNDYKQRPIPGLNRKLGAISEEIEDGIKRLYHEGVESNFSMLRQKISDAGVEMPELELNLAICRLVRHDFEGAHIYLERCGRLLSQEKYQDRFTFAKSAHTQLLMYTCFHLGQFEKLQEVALQKYIQAAEQDVVTWLGYFLLASGQHDLSKQLTQRQKPNPSAYAEQALLHLYWRDLQPNSAADRRHIEALRAALFRDQTQWTQLALKPRIYPTDLQADFRKLAENAQQYGVSDYLVHRYRNEPALQSWPGDKNVAFLLADAALRTGQTVLTYEVMTTYYRIAKRSEDAAKQIMTFFQDRLLFTLQQLPGDMPLPSELVRLLKDNSSTFNPKAALNPSTFPADKLKAMIETWLKSPYECEYAATNLLQFVSRQTKLYSLLWNRQDLRSLIWLIAQCTMDYGTLIPNEGLSLEALEDVVFCNLAIRLRRLALVQIGNARKQLDVPYLHALEMFIREQSDEELGRCLPYLLARTPNRSPALYQDPQLRNTVKPVLHLLSTFPDSKRRAGYLLLIGELEELDRAVEAAALQYQSLCFAAEETPAVLRLIAGLRLLRLNLIANQPQIERSQWDANSQLQLRSRSMHHFMLSLLEKPDQCRTPGAQMLVAHCLRRLEVIIAGWEAVGKLMPVHIEALLLALQIVDIGDLFVQSFYESFIGTDPLKELEVAEIESVLSLFADYGFANPTSAIGSMIKITLDVTITQSEMQLHATGSKNDRNRLQMLRSLRDDFACLEAWLSPEELSKTSDKVEPCAEVVRQFLQGGQRLSAQRLQEATQVLANLIEAANKPAGGSTIWLINDALAASQDWRTAYRRSLNLSDQKKRDEALLGILFRCLHCNEIEAASEIKAELGHKNAEEVQRLLQLWQNSEATNGGGAWNDFEVSEALIFLKRFEQAELAYKLLQKAPSALGLNQTTEELRQINLWLAIRTRAPIPIVMQAATELIKQAPGSQAVIEPSDLMRYLSCHATDPDSSLLPLVTLIAEHKLVGDETMVLDALYLAA